MRSQEAINALQDKRAAIMGVLKSQPLTDAFKAYVLIDALKLRYMLNVQPTRGVKTSIAGQPSKHEGLVVRTNDITVKFVDQVEFSYTNFKQFENVG
jgi:hypothetical protein